MADFHNYNEELQLALLISQQLAEIEELERVQALSLKSEQAKVAKTELVTDFILAFRCGQDKKVEQLLSTAPDLPKHYDKLKRNILYYLILDKQFDQLCRFPDLLNQSCLQNGSFPLDIAIAHNKGINELIELGSYRISQVSFDRVIDSRSFDLFILLVEYNSDLRQHLIKNKQAFMALTVSCNNLYFVEYLLQHMNISEVNIRQGHMNYLLEIKHDDPQIIQLFLDYGLDLAQMNLPVVIHNMVWKGLVQITDWILTYHRNESLNVTRLLFDIVVNQIAMFRTLVKHGAMIDELIDNELPICHAIRRCSLELICEYYKLGTDLDKPNSKGIRPIDVAYQHTQSEKLKLLLQMGMNRPLLSKEFVPSLTHIIQTTDAVVWNWDFNWARHPMFADIYPIVRTFIICNQLNLTSLPFLPIEILPIIFRFIQRLPTFTKIS